jgi:hypothetical protein
MRWPRCSIRRRDAVFLLLGVAVAALVAGPVVANRLRQAEVARQQAEGEAERLRQAEAMRDRMERATKMEDAIVGTISGADLHALNAFEQELGRAKGADRWKLRIADSTVATDEQTGTVVRRGPTGELEWSTPLGASLPNWRWPGLLTDGHLIFVKREYKGVTALDAATGAIVWDARVPTVCFLLSGDLLLLADGPRVVALSARTGAEVFRLSLPVAEGRPPVAVEEVAGLFLVQTYDPIVRSGYVAFLIDRAGAVRHRFPMRVLGAVPAGPDRVFLTSGDARRVTADDKTVWIAPFEYAVHFAYAVPAPGGALITAPGGDLLAWLHCHIGDCGVGVMRFDPTSGEVRWQAQCEKLGVWNKGGYEHAATAEWIGGELRVISRGHSGDFVEWLDGGTGERVRRSLRKRW